MASEGTASDPPVADRLDEAFGIGEIEQIREIRDRLTALLEASPTASEGHHWRAAPPPLPSLTPAEAQRANAARRKVMADVRAHPARAAPRARRRGSTPTGQAPS